jgi:hypothetical protein
MTRNTAWALVAIVALVLGSVTALLIARVPDSDIFAAISIVVTPVVGFLLYGKQERLEQSQQSVVQNTNGMNGAKDALLVDMWNHFKATQLATNPGTTNETTSST